MAKEIAELRPIELTSWWVSIRWILFVIVLFCFLYAFKVPYLYNSAFFSVAFLGISLLFGRWRIAHLIRLVNTPPFLVAGAFHLLAISVALAVPTFRNTADYSMVPTLLNGLVAFIGSALAAVVLYDSFSKKGVFSLFTHLLLLQILIMFSMLMMPEVRETIHDVVRTDKQIERMEVYGGLRGHGLSGSVAFGLAVTLGYLGFFLHFWFREQNAGALFKIAIFIMCFALSMTAGRAAVLGFAAGFVAYLPGSGLVPLFVGSFRYVLAGASLLTIVVYGFYSNDDLRQMAEAYSRYVFEFIWNYVRGQGLSVSSLDTLQSMYFIPPWEQYVFGDGRYTDYSGGYYLDTDAGYMRFLLYFGFIGSVVFYLAQIVTAGFFYQYCRKHVQNVGVALSFLVVMAFVYHYKGETVFFALGFLKIYYIYAFFCVLRAFDARRLAEGDCPP